jgi:cell division cycle 2-like protein
MSSSKSRWADEDPEAEAIAAQQKREKDEKRRAKAEKQRQQEEQAKLQAARSQSANAGPNGDADAPPTKRRRLSNEQHQQQPTSDANSQPNQGKSSLLQFPVLEWGPCRHVDNFERLNHIEEGSYGWVSRAKEITTGEVVALKKLKLDNSPDGFPVTGLREIQTLLEARHQNVVFLREVVVGNRMDE